jgi:glycogen phosphorylase
MNGDRKIAYFSMEIGLEETMPTYSGGLGILAGDTIRSAADMKIPMVAITLLHRKGYFHQHLDSSGWQTEEPQEWDIEHFLKKTDTFVTVEIEGRPVRLQAWRYEVKGIGGFVVPVFCLDADLPENTEWDRTLTHYLYGGDQHYRFCQEVILGIGGVRMLHALGYNTIEKYHMNEGHASLLTLELLDECITETSKSSIAPEHIQAVRDKCVFTTHTPVAAGHDQFPIDMVTRVIGDHEAFELNNVFCCGSVLNMTYLALNLSNYVNGVAKKHGEVSRHMFANYTIDSITNGVHAGTWVCPPLQGLFDRYIPGWREDNFSLRYALSIPTQDVWIAHRAAKTQLIERVNQQRQAGMDPEVLTLGFARRAASYKRADLLFNNLDKLKSIASSAGAFQIIYAGKAHPHDQEGKELIKKIYAAKNTLGNSVKIAYLENYDFSMAKQLTCGVDVWLNTPLPPMEASGTSGMKAALNGVPSLSILDGWWIEGCIEGVTGWAIGEPPSDPPMPDNRQEDAESFYNKLEYVVIPMYYNDRNRFLNMMLHAIALNGSFFNTQRMMQQYVLKAYFE